MDLVAFKRGFRQGLAWPIAWPMMWLLYGSGMIGYWIIDGGRRYDDTPWRWWHHAGFRLYNFGMCRSVFWNDLGGFDLWRPADSADAGQSK